MFERFKYNQCVNTVHYVALQRKIDNNTIEKITSIIFAKPIFSKKRCKLIFQNKLCTSEICLASLFIVFKALSVHYSKYIYREKLELYTENLICLTYQTLHDLYNLSHEDFDSWHEQFVYLNNNLDELYESGSVEDFLNSLTEFFVPLISYCSLNNKIKTISNKSNEIEIFDFIGSIELKAECLAYFITFYEYIEKYIIDDRTIIHKANDGRYIRIKNE